VLPEAATIIIAESGISCSLSLLSAVFLALFFPFLSLVVRSLVSFS
jgi:hypothetical protein